MKGSFDLSRGRDPQVRTAALQHKKLGLPGITNVNNNAFCFVDMVWPHINISW